MVFPVVEGADVEGGDEGGFDPLGGAGQDAGDDRELVEQGRVGAPGGGGLQGVLGASPFGVQLGVPGADPGAVGGGGGVGGCFEFGDQSAFGGVDPGQLGFAGG